MQPTGQNTTPDTRDLKARIATLEEEHADLKLRLRELESHRWLSPEEELERKRYQKLKLSKKDQIARLQRQLPVKKSTSSAAPGANA